jgi:hypothetical protein
VLRPLASELGDLERVKDRLVRRPMRLVRLKKVWAGGGAVASGESEGRERKSEMGVEKDSFAIRESTLGGVEARAVRKASYPSWIT